MPPLSKTAMRRCWAAYRLALRKCPVQTQMISTCAIWTAGDLLAQQLETQQGIEWRRTLGAAAFAGGFMGPLGHYWYLNLDRMALRMFSMGSRKYLAAKVAGDTFLAGPFEVLAFFSFMEAINGKGPLNIPQKIELDFWPTYITQLMYWPLFQSFNFTCVPVKHHLQVANIAGIFDSAFLSWANNNEGWLDSILSPGTAESREFVKGEQPMPAICPVAASAIASPVPKPRQ